MKFVSLKNCVYKLAVALLVPALVFASTPVSSFSEESYDGPEFTKTSTVNEDGTVTVRLSVSGKQKNATTTNIANVVLLYDITASMNALYNPEQQTAGWFIDKNWLTYNEQNYNFTIVRDGYSVRVIPQMRYTDDGQFLITYFSDVNGRAVSNDTIVSYTPKSNTTRLIDIANEAANRLGDALLADGNRTNVTLIPFKGEIAEVRQYAPGGTSAADFRSAVSYFSNGGVYQHWYSAGTNWEGALQAAANIAAKPENKNVPQNIILITDGIPTLGLGSNGDISALASYVNNNIKNKSNFSNLFYIYTADQATSTLTNLANGTSSPIYNGTKKESLNAAIDAIIQKVKKTTTYNTVKVQDGLSTTVHFPMNSGTSAPNFSYSTIDAAGNKNAWAAAPAASVSTVDGTPTINWDLSSVGDLNPGTTYCLEFTVVPNDGKLDDAALAALEGREAVTTTTNSSARLDYVEKTQIGTEAPINKAGSYSLPTQPSITVPYSTLDLQASFEGDRPAPDEVTVVVKRDGQAYTTKTLKKSEGYKLSVPASIDHTYTVEEVAPDGFEVTNPDPIALSGAPKQAVNVPITNEAIVSKLRILYQNTTGTPKGLANGQFTVTNTQTGESFVLTTDDSGYASSENPLDSGTYTIKQSWVPAMYQPLEGSYDLTVQGNTWKLSKDGQSGEIAEPEEGIKQITLSTQKIINEDIPETGGIGLWIYVLGFVVASTSVVFGLKKTEVGK